MHILSPINRLIIDCGKVEADTIMSTRAKRIYHRRTLLLNLIYRVFQRSTFHKQIVYKNLYKKNVLISFFFETLRR